MNEPPQLKCEIHVHSQCLFNQPCVTRQTVLGTPLVTTGNISLASLPRTESICRKVSSQRPVTPVTDTPAILSQELATQNLKMRKVQDVKQGCFVCLLPGFTAKTRFAIVFEPFDRISNILRLTLVYLYNSIEWFEHYSKTPKLY